jgi:hypothetical protein
MVRLSSGQDVVRALAAARDVEVLAYTLRPGPVLAGLQAAARRGARVRVRLEGAAFNDPKAALARRNRQIVGELAECGADAQLVDSDGTGIPLHAKALLTDGRLFLDDRNFGASDFVIRDSDPSAARAVREIFSGDEPAPNSPSFSIEKRDALAREAALLRAAGPDSDVVVESESFGYGPVCSALDGLAKLGVPVRLLVSSREAAAGGRERMALERLANDGVAVRVCKDSEKYALVGRRAWLGSANASPAFGGPMIDWGLCTNDRATVAAARERVEARWSTARPFKMRIATVRCGWSP